jgi:hypothetical protein
VRSHYITAVARCRRRWSNCAGISSDRINGIRSR